MVTNEPMRISVRGNAVEVEPRLLPTLSYEEAIYALFNAPSYANVAREQIEAHSRGTHPLVQTRPGLNAFCKAAYLAFAYHLPLTLSPDMIWLLIAQGFAFHVQQNAETMRSRFVTHEGKQTIKVRRDEFVRGFAGNDWEGVYAEFSGQIRQTVGDDRHALIVQTFSTTSLVDKAAVEVTLMSALQAYFKYIVQTRCGIPRFDLEGTAEDWTRLRAAAARLQEYDLDWWLPTLLPVLDRFVEAARGEQNPDFWGSFFKDDGVSGGPHISGHILQLFPYLLDCGHRPIPSPWLNGAHSDAHSYNHGCTSDAIPSGLSAAPFVWLYYGEEIPMRFAAGFVGITQDADSHAFRPETGWCVQEESN